MEKIDKNSEFLQSAHWREFQEKAGRKAFLIEKDSSTSPADKFLASIIQHELPVVGKYFYCPRGPILKAKSEKLKVKSFLKEMIELAKKENAGWIRIEPETAESLSLIKEAVAEKIVKAPHDMQPREIFVLDISKSEQQLLGEMKSKTRYNIGVAKKKGVKISVCSKESMNCMATQMEFIKLTREMAARQGITTHPEEYYKKMLQTFPSEMLKIYAAEYEGKIVATNLVLFYQEKAIYLHGASSNDNRNVMAPFLLQWQAILDAKQKGCTSYDFGGVKTLTNADHNGPMQKNNWAGITQFKMGFSPETKPIVFPGSYDIIVNPRKYAVYRGLQKAKIFLHKLRK